jgi:hypothetical protein
VRPRAVLSTFYSPLVYLLAHRRAGVRVSVSCLDRSLYRRGDRRHLPDFGAAQRDPWGTCTTSRRPHGLAAMLVSGAVLAAAVACAGTAPSGSSSQQPAPAKFTFRPLPCDSLPAPADSVDETLYMGIQAPVHKQPLPRGYADDVLAAVRQAFQAPHPMVLPVFAGTADTTRATVGEAVGATVLRPALAAEVEFTLGDTGATVGRVSTSSLSRTLDAALAAAPHRADSLHLLPPRSGPGSLQEPVKFYVALLSTRPRALPWAPLLMVRVPQWQGAHEARPIAADATASPPPSAIHGKVIQEWIVLQVVIDESGHALPTTVRLVEAHYREFARAAVARLESTSYRAASIGGCAVKGIAELRYSFAIAK